MSCVVWHEKIALFCGRDLPPGESAAVATHLSECAECRVFEQRISETRAMMLSLREVDDDEITAVRSGVLRHLQDRKRTIVPGWLRYAAAIAALAFGITLWRSRIEPSVGVARILPPPAAAARKPLPVASATTKVAAPKTMRHWSSKPKRIATPIEAAGPVIVKLFTNDPDVMIVWITD